jgi:hypothetical protein
VIAPRRIGITWRMHARRLLWILMRIFSIQVLLWCELFRVRTRLASSSVPFFFQFTKTKDSPALNCGKAKQWQQVS